MITERHNLACRMILKAISKTGSLGSCIVSKDIGSNERMTMQNLEIPETAVSRRVPKWLSHPASQMKTDLPPATQILCWLLSLLQKQQSNVGGWVLRSGRGQSRETGSTSAAPPATNSSATKPRQHRHKDLSKPRRNISTSCAEGRFASCFF